MSTHPYLSFSDSSYKTGCKVVGTSSSNSAGNGLTDKTVTDIQIPRAFNGKTIAEIGYEAFRGTKIAKVFIPKTILCINTRSFYFCSYLEEVRFEAGSMLKEIGRSSFNWCTKLKKIDIPAGVSVIESEYANSCFGNTASLSCISYLGSADFSTGYFFYRSVPSSILASSSYPTSMFGKQTVTSNEGKTCGVSNEPFVPINDSTRKVRRFVPKFIFFLIMLLTK